jgi:hypothetical protein
MGERYDETHRETLHSYYQGGRMVRKTTSRPKKAVPDMKGTAAPKEGRTRKKYPQFPTMRLSAENRDALKRLRDCLELRYEKDMMELNIKDLSIDDALTYLIILFARTHPQIAELTSMDSRMIKIMKYSEGL